MCAARRTTSTRLTRLAARASPYHGAVTLYEVPTVRQDDVNFVQAQAGPSRAEQGSSGTETPPKKSRGTVAKKTRTRTRTRTTSRQKTRKDDTISDSEPSGKPASVPPGSPSAKKPASKRTRVAISRRLDVPHPAPARWADVYAAIKDMRSRVEAPVDTMGCDSAQLREQDPKNQRFATLVSLMLSSQTKDEVTDAAVAKLRTAVGGSLSVQAVLDAEDATISEAIAKVGFWRRKTEYIKRTARRLQDDFDSDVPKTVEELCSLPGVGPKMAFLALQVAWKLNLGIGVDVHVHRITNRLGWHSRPTKNPEETRINLESWLPKELHGEINHMLVGFGQTICLPVGPKCGECTLSVEGLCPSARSARTKTSKATVRKRSSGADVEERSGPAIELELEQEELEAPNDRQTDLATKDE